jgi:very-short-patch-repair endonuclease
MLGRHDLNPRLLNNAREMRKAPTDAEHKLWMLFRSELLAGFKFRRQHPVGGYIVDFVCLKQHLVVELDGGQHEDPDERAYDAERTRVLESVNLRVLRIASDEMLRNADAVMETIYRELTKEPSPRPSP